MAKRCKHRSAFSLTEKCKTCTNRRRCRRAIKKNRQKAPKMALLILTLVVITIVLCKTMLKKDDEAIVVKTEVDLVEVQVASKAENIEMKQVTQDKKVVQISAEPVKLTAEVIEEDPITAFTESEKIAMGKTVYEEGRGECEEGRISIVAVILNRLKTRSKEYGAENGNVMEVITYPGAFAYPKDMTDDFFINCPEYEICMAAVEDAINGEDPTKAYFSNGAHHFYSIIEPLSEKETAKRENIDIYVIGNQAFHNDMN